MLYNDKLKLDNDLLPYLGHIHVSKIDYNLVDNFIAELHAEKGLSQSSLKKYVVLVRKVFKETERDGTIDHIIKRTENPRTWFSPEQYAALLEKCRSLRDNPPKRTEFDFGELYDFIVFMVHSFLRPSEWKLLQHKHIGVFSDDGVEQLVISFPNSKTKNANGSIESTTTEVAADLYLKKILPRHDGKNDYLFFNDTQDRTYAGDKVSKMFKYFVKSAGLGTDAYGQAHTTYSLRAFFSLVSDPEDRRQRSFQIGEECENKRSDVRKVLPQASITADAGVYQAVADEAGLRGKQGSEGGAPSQTADWFGFSEGTADVLRVLMGHLQVRTKETDQDSQDLVGELNSLLS